MAADFAALHPGYMLSPFPPTASSIVIQYGKKERALAAKRGAVRIFRKFETLVGYRKEIGVTRYQVDATQFDPVRYVPPVELFNDPRYEEPKHW